MLNINRSAHKNLVGSDTSRNESLNPKSPQTSLVIGIGRKIASANKNSRHFGERNRFINKGKSVSNSMNRIIRSSPKIHLKQHIHNQSSLNPHKKNSSIAGNIHSKLHLNRYAFEKGVPSDLSRNKGMDEAMHKVGPIAPRTSSSHQRSPNMPHESLASYNQSSVIGNSLSYTNDGRRQVNYITPMN